MTNIEIIEDDFEEPTNYLSPWKVLIVDDDPSVHQMTDFVLKGQIFFGRKLEIISSHSAADAYEVLKKHNDITLAIVDIVMENEQAGFTLVKQIRDTLSNHQIRLIIRTGQPGYSTEEQIAKEYEIQGYFNKTEITSDKLKAILYTALRSYQDITELEQKNRQLKQLSFDIREAMNGLVGYLQIASKATDQEKKNAALENANHFSKQMISTINDKLGEIDG